MKNILIVFIIVGFVTFALLKKSREINNSNGVTFLKKSKYKLDKKAAANKKSEFGADGKSLSEVPDHADTGRDTDESGKPDSSQSGFGSDNILSNEEKKSLVDQDSGNIKTRASSPSMSLLNSPASIQQEADRINKINNYTVQKIQAEMQAKDNLRRAELISKKNLDMKKMEPDSNE